MFYVNFIKCDSVLHVDCSGQFALKTARGNRLADTVLHLGYSYWLFDTLDYQGKPVG